MKTPSKLTTLANELSGQNFGLMSSKSIAWLKENVRLLRNPTAISRSIVRETNRKVTKFVLGNLYFFHYSPKNAESLPYYDVFPLVLVLAKYSDGFLGLNLHYLPVKMRALFLDKLLSYAIYNDEDDIKRIRITYDILSSVKRLRAYEPCLKRYLFGHINTRLLKVEPHEWETALFLPVEQFKKVKQLTVQKESLQMIRDKAAHHVQ
jgi:hypothetical protein